MKRSLSGIMVILLLTSMLALAFNIQPAGAILPVHNIDTGLDYATIQEAIDAAETADGDTITVDAGTYYENVIVDKMLTIIGAGQGVTIIDGGGTGNVVYVTADWVNITGFTATNSGSSGGDAGMKLYSVQNCYIENNNVSNNRGIGIYIYAHNPGYSNNNTVSNNTLNLNLRGIHMEATTDSAIMDNIIDSNSEIGIFLTLGWCENNIIKNNTISNSKLGMFSAGSNTGNLIFHNNFINNTLYQAYGGGTSFWDNDYPSGGNYWSDYSGTDMYSGPYQNETGSDGIGDTPYVLDAGNPDNYPLMKSYPWDPHDIGITTVTTSKTFVGQGYSLHINVSIFNYGMFAEIFNVTVYANTTIIDTLVNVTLTSRNSTTITFTWNTTGIAEGNYIISAYAWPVPEESDTADNNRVDGLVLVTIPGDVDGDQDVDIFDIVAIAGAYGSEEGDPAYDLNCDIDGDGDIDIYDIVAATGNYGESW